MIDDGRHPSRIIGLAGPTGSGKSTVARELVERLGRDRAAVLPVDAYYRDLSPLLPEEREATNFDDPGAIDERLLGEHLDRLGEGEPIERPVYRFESHTRAPEGEPFEPREHLILEGIFSLYWKRIRARLGLGVYLHVDEATCLDRRVQRDVRERGRTEESVRRNYEETVRPMQERFVVPTERHADLVLDGRASAAQSADAILSVWRKVTRREEERVE